MCYHYVNPMIYDLLIGCICDRRTLTLWIFCLERLSLIFRTSDD